MKIPKSIKSGPHTYEVIQSNTRDEAKGQSNWGKTQRSTLKIWLDNSLPQTRIEETFIHELFHVAYDQVGLPATIEKMDEEELVNRLSAQFYTLLKDNNMLK